MSNTIPFMPQILIMVFLYITVCSTKELIYILHLGAEYIVRRMEKIGITTAKERDIYVYGTEIILSTFSGLCALIIVSSFFRRPYRWLPYLAGFIPLRLFGGGYHAKNHLQCITLFTSCYLLGIVSVDLCQNIRLLIPIFSLTNLLIIYFYSPIEATNKRLRPIIYKKNRNRSIFLGMLNTIIAILYSIDPEKCAPWITDYLIGYVFAGIFMFVATLNRHHEEKNEKKHYKNPN